MRKQLSLLTSLDERWMFYGASMETIERIFSFGFDGSASQQPGIQGPGLYITSDASKADKFVTANQQRQKAIVFGRASLGNIQPPSGSNSSLHSGFHSLTASGVPVDWGTQFFILFENNQMYPDYVLVYQ